MFIVYISIFPGPKGRVNFLKACSKKVNIRGFEINEVLKTQLIRKSRQTKQNNNNKVPKMPSYERKTISYIVIRYTIILR